MTEKSAASIDFGVMNDFWGEFAVMESVANVDGRYLLNE